MTNNNNIIDEFKVRISEDIARVRLQKAKEASYIQKAIRTESDPANAMTRLQDIKIVRLLHAAIGLCTEAGEIQDALKKHIFYGKPLDLTNLREEGGDLFWYMAVFCDALQISFEEMQGLNIEKLAARYPDKFTEYKALNRDLEAERTILENNASKQ